MDTPLIVAVIALAGTLFTGYQTFRASRRATDVNEMAANLGWVKEMRQDAVDARKELGDLRGEVRELRRQLAVVTAEADHWIAQNTTLRNHAFRRGMTLDRLRELWPDPPAAASSR